MHDVLYIMYLSRNLNSFFNNSYIQEEKSVTISTEQKIADTKQSKPNYTYTVITLVFSRFFLEVEESGGTKFREIFHNHIG